MKVNSPVFIYNDFHLSLNPLFMSKFYFGVTLAGNVQNMKPVQVSYFVHFPQLYTLNVTMIRNTFMWSGLNVESGLRTITK